VSTTSSDAVFITVMNEPRREWKRERINDRFTWVWYIQNLCVFRELEETVVLPWPPPKEKLAPDFPVARLLSGAK
jgi:hypothetical protein